MGFNLGHVLTGAAQGFFTTGTPLGAYAGAATSLLGGSGSDATIAAGNSELTGALAASANDQVDGQIQQLQFDENLRHEHQQFQQMVSKKAESMSQVNTLREVAMQQRDADDSITKEYIKAIK